MTTLRVLQFTATLGSGGIQKLLTNVQKNIDRDKVNFDYCLYTTTKQFYTDDVIKMGSKIYGPNNNGGSAIIKSFKRYYSLFKTIKQGHYNIVHVNENLPRTAIGVVIARLAGPKSVVAHAHSDQLSKSNFFKISMSRWIIHHFATDYFACSEPAADWMFGSKAVNNSQVKIVKNGINSRIYETSQSKRISSRNQLKVEQDFILCQIGRFATVKNHKFTLKVFREILLLKSNAKLLLIGEGELKEKIIDEARQLGILNNIIFYGTTKDIPGILQSVDALILPSLYEGLGIVAIEAQAASVETFCASETIPKEVDITTYCNYISLSESAENWAKIILSKSVNYSRKSTTENIINSGYDISTVAKQLEHFYLDQS